MRYGHNYRRELRVIERCSRKPRRLTDAEIRAAVPVFGEYGKMIGVEADAGGHKTWTRRTLLDERDVNLIASRREGRQASVIADAGVILARAYMQVALMDADRSARKAKEAAERQQREFATVQYLASKDLMSLADKEWAEAREGLFPWLDKGTAEAPQDNELRGTL